MQRSVCFCELILSFTETMFDKGRPQPGSQSICARYIFLLIIGILFNVIFLIQTNQTLLPSGAASPASDHPHSAPHSRSTSLQFMLQMAKYTPLHVCVAIGCNPVERHLDALS